VVVVGFSDIHYDCHPLLCLFTGEHHGSKLCQSLPKRGAKSKEGKEEAVMFELGRSQFTSFTLFIDDR
jgi:hypothetical protein